MLSVDLFLETEMQLSSGQAHFLALNLNAYLKWSQEIFEGILSFSGSLTQERLV